MLRIPEIRLTDAKGRCLLHTQPLELEPGTILAVTGPSGAGKSLWVKSLFGWASPEQKPVLTPKGGALWLTQDPSQGLTPFLTVGDHFKEVPGGKDQNVVQELLAHLGLSKCLLARKPELLSGGERQRIMLALLLIQKPSVLVCDEPAASLDIQAEEQLWNLLLSEQKERLLTLIFVTHQWRLIKAHAKKVLWVEAGTAPFFGPTQSFFSEGTSPGHLRFLAGLARLTEPKKERQTAKEASKSRADDEFSAEQLTLNVGSRSLLADFSWKARPRDWWWCVGPSGSGKTSLARVLAGLQAATHGTFCWQGRPLPALLRDRPRAARQAIHYLYQHGSMMFNPARTVAAQLREVWSDAGQLECHLQDLGLDHLDLQRKPDGFSLGEMARLNLVRGLACSPRLILGDEILASLDLGTQTALIQKLESYQEATHAVIFLISHDPHAQDLHPAPSLVLNNAAIETVDRVK